MSDNSKLIIKINQLFHNAGIKQENRLDILVNILKSANTTDKRLSDDVRKILGDIDYTNKELVQEIFMNIGVNTRNLN
jgi:hypothetical protein